MCVILVCPPKVRPDIDVLRACHAANPHGAGVGLGQDIDHGGQAFRLLEESVAPAGGAGVVEFGQELFRAKDVDEGEHLVLFFLHGGQREAQNHGKDEAEQGRVEGHCA